MDEDLMLELHDAVLFHLEARGADLAKIIGKESTLIAVGVPQIGVDRLDGEAGPRFRSGSTLGNVPRMSR
jgi:hypothetical protein